MRNNNQSNNRLKEIFGSVKQIFSKFFSKNNNEVAKSNAKEVETLRDILDKLGVSQQKFNNMSSDNNKELNKPLFNSHSADLPQRAWLIVISTLNSNSIIALGKSCKTFYNLIFSNKKIVERLYMFKNLQEIAASNIKLYLSKQSLIDFSKINIKKEKPNMKVGFTIIQRYMPQEPQKNLLPSLLSTSKDTIFNNNAQLEDKKEEEKNILALNWHNSNSPN